MYARFPFGYIFITLPLLATTCLEGILDGNKAGIKLTDAFSVYDHYEGCRGATGECSWESFGEHRLKEVWDGLRCACVRNADVLCHYPTVRLYIKKGRAERPKESKSRVALFTPFRPVEKQTIDDLIWSSLSQYPTDVVCI